MNEEINLYSPDYMSNLTYFNECKNNTKSISNSEMELIFEECGCDINYVKQAANFDFEDEKYQILSCFIINGGEGQGENYEEISKVIAKDNVNGTSNVYFVCFSSYYDSWNGNSYEDSSWSVVRPVKRITIDFIA